MTDAPPLDFAAVARGVAETAAEFTAMLSPDPTVDIEAEDEALRAMDLDPDVDYVSPGPISVIHGEWRSLDAALRADCELLAAWDPGEAGDPLRAYDRSQMLEFVVKRRGVSEMPAWANDWVKGETDA